MDNELRCHPVLIDRAAIRLLTTSPMAIDLYLWLAFRLHQLPKETPISWDKLWRQFGAGVAALKPPGHDQGFREVPNSMIADDMPPRVL